MIWKWIKGVLAKYGPAEGFFADDPQARQAAANERFKWNEDGITGSADDGSPCSISWLDLRSVQFIYTGDRFSDEYFFAFRSKDGRSCRIPESAVSHHQHLFGWLKKLPGFDEETMARICRHKTKDILNCWTDPTTRSSNDATAEPLPVPAKFHWDDEGVVGADQAGTPLRISWNDLARVTVVTTDDGPAACDVFFVLESSAGQSCVVPQEADTNGSLLEQLQSLNGFDNRAFVEAMKSAGNASFLCWVKAGR